jgi:hypothetical protein
MPNNTRNASASTLTTDADELTDRLGRGEHDADRRRPPPSRRPIDHADGVMNESSELLSMIMIG